MPPKTTSYDLAVAYRIYPGVSKAAVGLPFGEDKLQLSEICLRSLKECLGSLRVKVWALLDGCPPEYELLFRRYIDPEDLIVLRFDGIGNRATFSKQVDILLEQQDAELVYFAEDDYFYLPGQFHAMLDFANAHTDVHCISPYDHLDCYTLELHRTPKWIRTYASRHWRTAASTCMTFLTRKTTLAKYESVFRSYAIGSDDCGLWLSLTKQRVFNPIALLRYFFKGVFGWKSLLKAWWYGWRQILFGKKLNLWIPIPAIATHLSNGRLSPGIAWCALMEQEADALSGNLRTYGR
jgi:hypothetical protein